MPDTTEMKEKDVTDMPVNLTPIGKSGTLVSSSKIDDEYLTELKGIAGQQLFYKMIRSDSTIRKSYHAVNNPIRSAKWSVEPASDSPQDIKVAALIQHILFHNIKGGWKGKLDEILTFPWHAHAIFEVVHENRTDKAFGPYTGLKNLAFRDQRTITEWNFVDGELDNIRQEQSGDLEVDVAIPANVLLIFYNEKKGDDTGFAFLRMLYGNYKRKLLYKQLQAIGIERSALAVPHLKVPKDLKPDSDQYALAEEQLKNFSLAETAYFMLPEGYELTFSPTNTFDPSKTQVAIKAENEEIAGAMVGMFLEMGIGGNSGNQAGTEVSAAFFRDGIEYIADKICDGFNENLIPSLVRLNFGDTVEVMPKLVHAGITDQAGKELMEIVTGYVKSQVITVDPMLEDYVRKQHNLPKKALGETIDGAEENEDDNTDPDDEPADGTKPPTNEDDKPALAKPAAVDLSDKTFDFSAKSNDVPNLMSASAKKISDVIKSSLEFSGNKFINDVMNRYKQLPDHKKQTATTNVKVGGGTKFKDALKSPLSEASALALAMVRKEVPSKKTVELKSPDSEMIRLSEKYGAFNEIRLNDLSALPAYIQVLIAKQSELISQHSLNEMISRLSFTYSSIDLKSKDANVIKQNMQESLDEFIKSSQVVIKGENVAALMVNESRNSFFFDSEVLEEIHSFTFMNMDPKSPICKELAGTTFNNNDAESLRYTPPLHHNCKSYLRANLKVSKGVEKLEIKTLSPSAKAVESMTL